MKFSYKLILICLLLFMLQTVSLSIDLSVYADEDEPQIVYFYSTRCLECSTLRAENAFQPLYDLNLVILEYAIDIDTSAAPLFNQFVFTYSVPDLKRVVPILFVGDQYFSGIDDIRTGITSGSIQDLATSMPLLEIVKDTSSFSLTNFILLGLAGILSPCLIAVILLFISLLSMTSNKRVLTTMSIIFILTLFIMNLLIGTVLYQVFIYLSGLSKIFNLIINWVVISLASIMLFLNLYDFIQTLKKRYEKLKGNMPSGLQKMNKGLIEKLADRLEKGSSMVYLGTFIVGVIISFTRFFSNPANVAQIIELMYVTDEFLRGFLLLLIYNIVFVLPLITLAYIGIKSQSVIGMSVFFREKLHYIKLANVIIFLTVIILYLIIVI